MHGPAVESDGGPVGATRASNDAHEQPNDYLQTAATT